MMGHCTVTQMARNRQICAAGFVQLSTWRAWRLVVCHHVVWRLFAGGVRLVWAILQLPTVVLLLCSIWNTILDSIKRNNWLQGSKRIRQRAINWCTSLYSPMHIQNNSFSRLQLVFGRLNTQRKEFTIQNLIKVLKVVKINILFRNIQYLFHQSSQS